MRFVFKSFFAGLFLLFLGGFCIILAIVDNSPAVPSTRIVDARDAARARELVKEFKRGIEGHGKGFSVIISEQELNGLMAIMHRAMPRLNGEAQVWPEAVRAAASFRLPGNPLGDYINLGVSVLPSKQGLSIDNVTVGEISLPGGIATAGIRQALELLLGQGEGSLVDLVESVTVEGKKVRLGMRGVADLDQRLTSIRKHVQEVRQSVAPAGNSEDIQAYAAAILEIDAIFAGSGKVSISQFIRPVFQMAMERGDDPARENQAAILALAILFGHAKMDALAGDILPSELRGRRLQSGPVTLGGREDLRQHFIISAGLKVISDQGVSLAVGEFKELLDAGTRGGSGFSFVDLAADRAGVRFAAAASDASSGKARRLQETVASLADERLIFPDVAGLPEGIGQQSFERIFGNMESAAYKDLVTAIDDCIEQLPAYGRSARDSSPTAGRCRLAEKVPPALLQRTRAR